MDSLLVLITRYLFFISFVLQIEALHLMIFIAVVVVKHQERGVLLAVGKAGLEIHGFWIQEFQGDRGGHIEEVHLQVVMMPHQDFR